MNFEDDINKYNACFADLSIHLEELHKHILASNELLEGNCFYSHLSKQLTHAMLPKQVNLYNIAKKGNNICEIGFNAGHSALLFLLNHPSTNIEFTIFDLGEHAYTRPCLEYIKSSFPSVKVNYIEGNSIETMPKWIKENSLEKNKYNIIHVDGGHWPICIENDMKNADLLVADDGYIIVDDTELDCINNEVDKYIMSGKYKEINIFPTTYFKHRIIQRCNINASN